MAIKLTFQTNSYKNLRTEPGLTLSANQLGERLAWLGIGISSDDKSITLSMSGRTVMLFILEGKDARLSVTY